MKKILTLLLFASSVTFAKTSIEVQNAYIKLPPPGSSTAAMFGDFKNNENQDRKLIKITESSLSDDFELHEMSMDNGKMSMRKIENIALPKKKTTALRPGGLHIMIFNLKRPLLEKEIINLEGILDNQEKIQIKAQVLKPN